MNFINRNAGFIALFAVCLAIGAFFYPVIQDNLGAFDIPTRFPNGHWDTGGGYYVDGTAIIDGSGNVSGGTGAFTGAVSGTTGTFTSTLAVTATTTLSDGLQLRNSTGLCVDFYATSTATKVKMVASSTAQIVNGFAATGLTENAGVILLQYGACSI